MALSDVMQTDATNLASAEFGESITHYLGGAVGSATTFDAIVVRQEPTMVDNQGRTHDAEVLIPVSALTSDPTTADTLSVVLTVGKAAETVRITSVQAKDPGFWTCEVRR